MEEVAEYDISKAIARMSGLTVTEVEDIAARVITKWWNENK